MTTTESALTIKTEVEVPQGMLSDLMITAFDGTYGSCWTWSGPNPAPGKGFNVQESNEAGTEDVWLSVDIVLDEPVEENGPTEFTVSHQTLVLGMQRILDEDSLTHDVWKKFCDRIRQGVFDDDAGELDAGDADAIVQWGLFGQEVW